MESPGGATASLYAFSRRPSGAQELTCQMPRLTPRAICQCPSGVDSSRLPLLFFYSVPVGAWDGVKDDCPFDPQPKAQAVTPSDSAFGYGSNTSRGPLEVLVRSARKEPSWLIPTPSSSPVRSVRPLTNCRSPTAVKLWNAVADVSSSFPKQPFRSQLRQRR